MIRLFFLIGLIAGLGSLEACSRVFCNSSSQKTVARTMDLYIDDNPQFFLSCRNKSKVGGQFLNTLQWTSKWGSILITAFNEAISEGVNEKGLAAHLLYLHDTEYEIRDQRPAISNARWIEYILDNFATVSEAIANITSFQIVPVEVEGKQWPLHLCLEDATGDSAIIEFIEKKIRIHHGRKYTVMTNEPSYDVQLKNLKRYRYFGGDLPLPGDVDSMSRFVRASAFLKTLPPTSDMSTALGFLLGVIRSVQVPFGSIDTSGNKSVDSWPTRWISAIDFKNMVYYFNSTSSPNIVWIDLKSINFSPKKEPQPIKLQTPTLSGDLSQTFSSK